MLFKQQLEALKHQLHQCTTLQWPMPLVKKYSPFYRAQKVSNIRNYVIPTCFSTLMQWLEFWHSAERTNFPFLLFQLKWLADDVDMETFQRIVGVRSVDPDNLVPK